MPLWELIHADAASPPIDKIGTGRVQAIICSPPYWGGVRDYGLAPSRWPAVEYRPLTGCAMMRFEPWDGVLGEEPDPNAYVAHLLYVFRGLSPLLRDDALLFLNVDDSYSSGSRKYRGTDGKNPGVIPEGHPRPNADSLGPKQRGAIPERIVLALQADGWIYRSAFPWLKCISGGARVYARTQKGDAPVMVKDLVRLRPETVKLWDGQKWNQVISFSRSAEVIDHRALHAVRSSVRLRGEIAPVNGPIELVLRSGERIGCTRDHRWPTGRGLLRVDELKVGDVLDSCRLPEPDVPKRPVCLPDRLVGWFVGLYLAEGSRSGNTIQISSHAKEQERFGRFRTIAAQFQGTCSVHQTGGNKATANLTGPVLLGIIGHYIEGRVAKDKHLSSACWVRSDEFLMAVLEGYLSGDGHWDAPNSRWRLGFCNNDAWAADLRSICARLGVSLRLSRAKHMLKGRIFPGYRGQIRFPGTERDIPPGGYERRPDTEIVSIECSRARQFWDIEVESEPHLFALASGVLTHNCNALPESVLDRPHNAHEPILMFSKGLRYYYDPEAVRRPSAPSTIARDQYSRITAGKDGPYAVVHDHETPSDPSGRHRRTTDFAAESVDHAIAEAEAHLARLRRYRESGGLLADAEGPTALGVAPVSYHGDHYAVYPPALVRPLILCSTSAKGCCPTCYAPWVRVTDRARPPAVPPSELDRYGDGSHGIHRKIGSSYQKWLDANPTKTLGWGQSCNCPGHRPIPCTVLDPFAGSGTTLEVADALGRRSVGLEASDKSLADARMRLERPHAPRRRPRRAGAGNHAPLFPESR